MDTKDAAYEALHDTITDLMDSFAKLQYKVDLMEPLTPGRLPSAEEFDSLARRVDDVDDTLAEKIIELQNRVDKLETK